MASFAHVSPKKQKPGWAPYIVRHKGKSKTFHNDLEGRTHRNELERRELAAMTGNTQAKSVGEVGEALLATLSWQKSSTRRRKEGALRGIKAKWPTLSIRDLSADMIVEFRASISPLSTQKQYMSVLRAICDYAVLTKLIAKSPFSQVPQVRRSRASPQSVADKLLDMPDIETANLMLSDPPLHLRRALAVLLLLGTRISETLALDKEDYHAARGEFRIHKALTPDGTLKNLSSRRWCRVYPELVAILGPDFAEGAGRLLVDADGKPWTYPAFLHEFYLWQVSVGIATRIGWRSFRGHFTVHQLRHAFAAIMIWMTMDLKVISAQMGHKTADMTRARYAYLIRDRRGGDVAWRTLRKEGVVS